jgi:hypothetical protein
MQRRWRTLYLSPVLSAMAKLHDRMFIAQSTLEAWVDSGKVEVSENIAYLKKSGRAYILEPAVRFVSVVPEGTAPSLIGKVLTEQRIIELGGELMGNSVLFGEAAFSVEQGYVGTLRSMSTEITLEQARRKEPR